MINKKIALTSVVLGVVGISGFYVFSSYDKANDVKAQVTAQAVPETKVKKQNLALETALNDFKSLDEFNTKFVDTSDEAWMIPDVSPEGSNDGGNSHGWTTFPTKQRAHDKDIIDNNTGKSVYTIKSSDGAIVGDIRKALAERDAKENPAIKTALHDYASLEEFNAKFSPVEDSVTAIYTPDEQWMIPDLSDVGSNDGGKTHGWTGARTKEEAKDSDVTDMKTGKVVYTFKVSDGASAGAIREALSERDKA